VPLPSTATQQSAGRVSGSVFGGTRKVASACACDHRQNRLNELVLKLDSCPCTLSQECRVCFQREGFRAGVEGPMPLYFPKQHSFLPGELLSLILMLFLLVLGGFCVASHGGQVVEPINSVVFGS